MADAALRVSDGYRAKNSELGAEGVPFARAANVRDGFHLAEADRVMHESLHKVGDKFCTPGDVVFTSKGTVGRFAFVTAKTPRFVYSPQLCFLRVLDSEVVNPRFLFYWMHTPECIRQFHALKGQTDMADYISLRDQRLIEISLPPVADQRRIAGVLRAIEGKAEHDWLTANRLADLARCSIDSTLSEFDFEQQPLSELAIVHREPVKLPSELPYIGLDQMPRGNTVLSRWLTEDAPRGQALAFRQGDILFGKLRPYFRKAGIALIDGRCSTEVLVLRPVREEHYALVLRAVTSDAFFAHCTAVSSGTRMPRSEWSAAGQFFVGVASGAGAETALKALSAATRAVYSAVGQRVAEMRRLRDLLSTLLPAVIAGALPVAETYLSGASDDAERAVLASAV